MSNNAGRPDNNGSPSSTDTSYDKESFDGLIAKLRRQRKENLQELFEVRWKKLEHYAPLLSEMSDWVEDAGEIDNVEERTVRFIEIYETIVQEFPVVHYWKMYLNFALDQHRDKGMITEEQLKVLFTRALRDCVYDYRSSHEIWGLFLAFFKEVFDRSQSDDDRDTLLKLHLKCISYPHQRLADSFSSMSSVVSEISSADYETHMKAANKVYSDALKKQKYYDNFELELSRSETNHQVWCAYIEQVSNYAKTTEEVTTLFERSLYASKMHSVDPQAWIPVWLTYIYALYERDTHSSLERVLSKFVRSLPDSSVSYAEYITNCQLFEDSSSKFLAMRSKVEHLKIKERNIYDDWKTLALAIISYEFTAVKNNNEELVDSLYSDITNFAEYAIFQNNDVYHSVEKLVIAVLEDLDDLDHARIVVENLTDRFKDQCEVWIYAFEFEKRNKASYEEISSLFLRATDNITNINWPERLIEEWLGFERIHGSLTNLKLCLVKANKILRILNIQQFAESQATDSVEERQSNTAKNTGTAGSKNQSSRSRESYTVKVSKLPTGITTHDMEMFFESCGTPKSIKFTDDDKNGTVCLVEFADEQEILSALSRDKKKLKDSEVKITRHMHTILFASNYPPAMTHDMIKRLFDQMSGFVDIRFPVQTRRKARRFCYVEYDNSDNAVHAQLRLNGQEIIDPSSGKEYKLNVQFSNPNKSTESNTENVIEVHIGNLDTHKVDESILLDVFSACGDIERITIPLPLAKKEEGFRNNGFAFIRFRKQSSLEAALELNKKSVCGRQISVSKADSTKLTPYDFDDKSTVALFSLMDTTTSVQIRTQVSKAIGPIKKLELYPEVHGALVEFVHPRDVGRAQLVLPSTTLDGKALEVGSRHDLLQIYKSPKSDPSDLSAKKEKAKLTMVPTSIKRRRK